VDLHRVLEAAIRMASNEVRHRARLIRSYGEVPLVSGSEAKLGQVFINLIVNAAHAIPEGRVATNEIRILTRTDGAGCAVVEIHDTGSGIPPSILPRVFDAFFTTKAVVTGTGLGLAICHRIVTAYGGSISVDSQVGRGSTFRTVVAARTRQGRGGQSRGIRGLPGTPRTHSGGGRRKDAGASRFKGRSPASMR